MGCSTSQAPPSQLPSKTLLRHHTSEAAWCEGGLQKASPHVILSEPLDSWALKDEAVRIFSLADKDNSGFIDMAELANVRNSSEYAESMMAELDDNKDGKLNLGEWLEYVKRIFDKKESTCLALLKLYEKQIGQNREVKLDTTEWALKDEAVRIFRLADKDFNGFIDLSELANVRNSEGNAEIMMGELDENKDGKMSLVEWLEYVKKIFDKKESTCQALLKLYEKQIGQNKEIKYQKS